MPESLDNLLKRIESLIGDGIRAHIDEPWFPPAYWALVAAVTTACLQALLQGSLHAAGLGIMGILGSLFGFGLHRLNPSLSREAARLEPLAAAGDAWACRRLAQMYLKGAPGLAQSLETARKWFLTGARAGDPESMHFLAHMLEWGSGGPRDAEAAAAWRLRVREASGAEPGPRP